MTPDSHGLSIDLGKKNNENTADTAFKWAVNSGRIIIVFVELLTLGALAFRFFIDRKIVDLQDKIKQKQAFVDSLSKKEALYRDIQTRLDFAQEISNSSKKKMGFINELTELLNSNNFISNTINSSGNIISIEGQAYSIFTVNNLIDTLKKNKNIGSIYLDDLTSQNQGIHFKISALFQDKNE